MSFQPRQSGSGYPSVDPPYPPQSYPPPPRPPGGYQGYFGGGEVYPPPPPGMSPQRGQFPTGRPYGSQQGSSYQPDTGMPPFLRACLTALCCCCVLEECCCW